MRCINCVHKKEGCIFVDDEDGFCASYDKIYGRDDTYRADTTTSQTKCETCVRWRNCPERDEHDKNTGCSYYIMEKNATSRAPQSAERREAFDGVATQKPNRGPLTSAERREIFDGVVERTCATQDTADTHAHYLTGTIEAIDAIEDWGLGFRLANVVKYIARADHKGDRMGDLKKALWYLQREIKKNA